MAVFHLLHPFRDLVAKLSRRAPSSRLRPRLILAFCRLPSLQPPLAESVADRSSAANVPLNVIFTSTSCRKDLTERVLLSTFPSPFLLKAPRTRLVDNLGFSSSTTPSAALALAFRRHHGRHRLHQCSPAAGSRTGRSCSGPDDQGRTIGSTRSDECHRGELSTISSAVPQGS